MKKKLLTLAMAAIMVMGLSTTAFATDTSTTETVVKTVTGDSAPEQTYSFTVAAVDYENAPSTVKTQPEVTIDDISGEGSATLDLSEITEIGIYYYTISEDIPDVKVAGMTYDDTVYNLTVTAYMANEGAGPLTKAIAIYKNEEKVESATFNNTYTANTLTVIKDVTGNLGDTTKEFEFTVTFTNKDTENINWINANAIGATASGVTITANSDGSYTFKLKDGARAVFTNIPKGISYTVVENDANKDDYITSYDEYDDGTMDGKDVETTVTNKKEQSVATGINLDSLPYIMILAIVLLGATYVIIRRRVSDRY